MDIFIQRIQQLRKARGWSKTTVAKKLGVKLQTYCNWGYRLSNPSLEMLSKIASIFDTSTDYLLGRTDSPTPIHSEVVKPLTAKQAQACAKLISTAVAQVLKEITKGD